MDRILRSSYAVKIFFLVLFVWVFLSCVLVTASYPSLIFRYVVISISLIYFFKILFEPRKPLFISFLMFFLTYISMYGLFFLLSGEEVIYKYTGTVYASSKYLRDVLGSLLPLFPVYYFTKEGCIDDSFMKKLLFICVVFGCVIFYRYQQMLVLDRIAQGSLKREFTNGTSYILLSLLPAILLLKNKLSQLLFASFLIFIIFLSYKRGASLIAIACFCVYLFNALRISSFGSRLGLIIAICTLVFCFGFFLMHQYETSEYFAMRIDSTMQGSSSGRDELYANMIEYVKNDMTPTEMIFGLGANGVLKISLTYAHNDFLEILVEQGVIGLLLFVVFLILYAYFAFQSFVKEKNCALVMFFLICFGRTIFSMFYNPIDPYMTCANVYMDLFLGYYLCKSTEFFNRCFARIG